MDSHSRFAPLRPATLLLGLLMGGVGALAAALLRLGFRGLQWLLTHHGAAPARAAAALPLWARFCVPVGGALAATLVLWIRRQVAVRSGDKPRRSIEYVEATRQRHGLIPLEPDLWRTGSASFSVSSGAAVGREGSMIQFAASITSNALRLTRRFAERRLPKLFAVLITTDPSLALACGVAGGVTTAYAAPIAAVFFGAEIALGEWTAAQLAPMALAAGVGHFVAQWLLGPGPLYPIDTATHTLARLGWLQVLLMLAAAVAFGCLGPLYQRTIRGLGRARALPLPLLWSGLLVGLLSLIDPRVWGNGETALKAALGTAEIPGLAIGAQALLLVLVLRLAATAFCVGTGTVGGVFTPTLFTGGTLGTLAGLALQHAGWLPTADRTLWAVLGMSCLITAATHAPLMGTCMAAELTGDWHLVPGLALVNLIAWAVSRRISPEALYGIASQNPAHLGVRVRNSRL